MFEEFLARLLIDRFVLMFDRWDRWMRVKAIREYKPLKMKKKISFALIFTFSLDKMRVHRLEFEEDLVKHHHISNLNDEEQCNDRFIRKRNVLDEHICSLTSIESKSNLQINSSSIPLGKRWISKPISLPVLDLRRKYFSIHRRSKNEIDDHCCYSCD